MERSGLGERLAMAATAAFGILVCPSQALDRRPECAAIEQAWNAFITEPAIRISAASQDGREYGDQMMMVGDSVYRQRNGHWTKDAAQLKTLGRVIIVNHTVERGDPESCEMLGQLEFDGETFTLYGFASQPIHKGLGSPRQHKIWIDNKGRIRAHSTPEGMNRYTYDGVTAPVVEEK
jgi:hypothetical protein